MSLGVFALFAQTPAWTDQRCLVIGMPRILVIGNTAGTRTPGGRSAGMWTEFPPGFQAGSQMSCEQRTGDLRCSGSSAAVEARRQVDHEEGVVGDQPACGPDPGREEVHRGDHARMGISSTATPAA